MCPRPHARSSKGLKLLGRAVSLTPNMSSLKTRRPKSCLIRDVALFIAACAALPFGAHAAIAPDDEASRFVQERFQKQDTNGDGKLSPEEVGSRRLFNRMDAYGDGFVTRAEAKTFFSNMS